MGEKSTIYSLTLVVLAVLSFFVLREIPHLQLDGLGAFLCTFGGYGILFLLYLWGIKYQLNFKLDLRSGTRFFLIASFNTAILFGAAIYYFYYLLVFLLLSDLLYFNLLAKLTNSKRSVFGPYVFRLVFIGGIYYLVIRNKLMLGENELFYRNIPLLISLWLLSSAILQHMIFVSKINWLLQK
jgi:hypothetical protein